MASVIRCRRSIRWDLSTAFCLAMMAAFLPYFALASEPPTPFKPKKPEDSRPQPPKKPDEEKPHLKHKVESEKGGSKRPAKGVHEKVIHESVNHEHWIPRHWHHPWHHWYWYQTGVIYYYPHRFWHYVLISNLDLQVEALQQTLVKVEAGNLSRQDKQAARAELAAARAALAKALAETNANNQRLRAIEKRLLEQQTAFSEVKEADSQVQKARNAVDRELHRVLGFAPHKTPPTPEDFTSEAAGLNHEQQDKLAADGPFQEALQTLVQATLKLSKVQQALYETDADWVAERDKAKQSAAPLTGDLARDVEATLAAIKAAISSLGSTAGS